MRAAYPYVPARPGVSWLVVFASIAAALAGVGVSMLLAPVREAAPVQAGIVLRAGPASLPMASDWKRSRRSAIPGLEGASSASALSMDVALDERMPDAPSLLPASLLDALGVSSARPEATTVGGRRVWFYDALGRARSRIAALALPTTQGVVTVACMAGEDYALLTPIECKDTAAALELHRAAPLRPTPETAAYLVAGPTIARLDHVRSVARRALASTRSPVRRAREARRIALAYAAAARRLKPLARGAAVALPRSLAALARHHRSLAAASATRDALNAARASRAIDRGERRLASQLRAVSR